MAELRKIPLKGWRVDVNTGTSGAPVWTQVKGIRTPNLQIEHTTQDTTTLDSDGWGSDGSTLLKWKLSIEGLEGYTSTYVRDPGQVAVKAKGILIGDESEMDIRFYRLNPDEGFSGTAQVKWNGTGGPITEYTRFQVEMVGQGALAPYDPTP